MYTYLPHKNQIQIHSGDGSIWCPRQNSPSLGFSTPRMGTWDTHCRRSAAVFGPDSFARVFELCWLHTIEIPARNRHRATLKPVFVCFGVGHQGGTPAIGVERGFQPSPVHGQVHHGQACLHTWFWPPKTPGMGARDVPLHPPNITSWAITLRPPSQTFRERYGQVRRSEVYPCIWLTCQNQVSPLLEQLPQLDLAKKTVKLDFWR